MENKVTVEVDIKVNRAELDRAIADAQKLNSTHSPWRGYWGLPPFWDPTRYWELCDTETEGDPTPCKPEEEPLPFAIGDVVYLKSELYSSEPPRHMTVAGVTCETAFCIWMDNGLQEEKFDVRCIAKR
jgi:hypothetical protein